MTMLRKLEIIGYPIKLTINLQQEITIDYIEECLRTVVILLKVQELLITLVIRKELLKVVMIFKT